MKTAKLTDFLLLTSPLLDDDGVPNYNNIVAFIEHARRTEIQLMDLCDKIMAVRAKPDDAATAPPEQLNG